MKAWRLENTEDPDQGNLIVFADTRNEAKKRSGDLMYDNWIDLRATRFPGLDDKENLTQQALDLTLWRDYGWHWYEVGSPSQDEATDEEFLSWWSATFDYYLERGLI